MFHSITESADGIRVTDVWKSQEPFESFFTLIKVSAHAALSDTPTGRAPPSYEYDHVMSELRNADLGVALRLLAWKLSIDQSLRWRRSRILAEGLRRVIASQSASRTTRPRLLRYEH